MNKLFLILSFLYLSSGLSAQLKYDANWVLGSVSSNSTNTGANLLNFNDDILSIEAIVLPFRLRATHITFSTKNGDLISTTNGIKIANNDFLDITGATILNDGDLATDDWSEYGYGFLQGILALPSFDSLHYDYFHEYGEFEPDTFTGVQTPFLLNSRLDYEGNDIFRNEPVFEAHRLSGITATKHANGRDWWIVTPEEFWTEFHTILFSPEGINNYNSQIVGEKPLFNVQRDGGGQNVFSPDGSTYVDFDSWNGVRIFDFDRCTGVLSNFRWVEFEEKLSFGTGAAISPNSRYLYYTSATEIYQLDLQADSLEQSIEVVGTYDNLAGIGFRECQLGPDNRLYIGATGGAPFLHVINNPDMQGVGCDFELLGIELLAPTGPTLPHYPNYNLGALMGSSCDTITTITEINQELSGQFKLSPNPLSQSQPLSLDYTITESMQSQLQLLNITGQIIWQKETQLENGNHQIPIATPQAKGVYFLHIRNEEGESVVRKVVVQ